MNSAQSAAFVAGQAALLNANIAMMQAANVEREIAGKSPAYGEEQFHNTIKEFEIVLSHNGAIGLFNESNEH